LVTHLRRERNPQIIAAKKSQVLRTTGKLQCEVCRFDFEESFGKIGADFCEVHHNKPLSQSKHSRKTKPKDLAILCSNCHRMIHKTNPIWSVSKLRAYLKRRG